MADFPFNNNSSAAERRRVVENDRKASTYFHQAQSSIDDELKGRFAASGRTASVVGSSPITYPTQPSTSPFACDPCGQEPPLGYRIDDQEPVGEIHERGSPSTASPALLVEGAPSPATALAAGGRGSGVPPNPTSPTFKRRA